MRDADEVVRDGGDLKWEGAKVADVDGIAILEAVVKDIEAVDIKDDPRKLKGDRREILARLYQSPGRMHAVAKAQIRRGNELEALLIRIRTSIASDDAKRLERQLKRTIQEQANKALRLAGEDEQIHVAAALDWDGCPPGLVVPEGWSLNENALAKLRRTETGYIPIPAGSPIIMTRRYFDVDSGVWSVELAWQVGGEWVRECVGREQAMETRALVRLASRGAPVSSANSKLMIEWLAALDQDPQMPLEASTIRMGWVGKGAYYYVLGDKTITPIHDKHHKQIKLITQTSGGQQLAEAVNTKGTWEGWLAALELIDGDPSPWAGVYAAATAPLLKILDAPNFGIDWAGPSGSGKSTTLELITSTYGNPRFYLSWGGTVAGTTGAVGTMCDLPFCLDEGQKVPARQRDAAAALLHTIIDGAAKPKGTLGRNGTSRVERWHVPLFSTSETGIVPWAQHEGVRARVMELYGRPLGIGQADKAEQLQMQVRANYGHLFEHLIKWLCNADRGDRKELLAMYNDTIRTLSATPDLPPMARRAARYVAAISVARWILHERLDVPEPSCDPIGWLWAQVQECMGGSDKARGAAQAAWSWIWAQQDRLQKDVRKAPVNGWIGVWDDVQGIVGVRRPDLEKALGEAGYSDPTALYREWIERKWIKADKRGYTYRMKDGKGARVRLIGFIIEAGDSL